MTRVDEYLDRLGGPALLAWHHHNGTHRSAADYLLLYRDLMLSGLSNTRLIYLDTNYWIRLRDAAIGKGIPEAVKLLELLRGLVRSRKVLCVSHIYSFLEVGKQESASLQASADLMDELCEGVVIASTGDLLQWECAEFIRATLNREVGEDLCPWTKVGLIHKSELPVELPGRVTPAGRESVLKAMIDALWNFSFKYALAQFDWDTKSRLRFELDDKTLSIVAARKVKQLARGVTRDQVRLAEFSQQLIDHVTPVLAGLLREWHADRMFPEGMAALLQDVDALQRAAVQTFEDRSLGHLLPGLAIMTELYALYETDRQNSKPMITSDWFDSCHAAAALPYCDVFLTERGLAHRLRMLKADAQYDCVVVGTIEDAVSLFEVGVIPDS